MPPVLIPLDVARCDAIAADARSALPDLDPGAALALLPQVAAATGTMLRATGATPPWGAYLCAVDGRLVGTCAFKAPPAAGEVEIAYFTFPGHEGRGHGRAMAAALRDIAFAAPEVARVSAHTRPEMNASSAILSRLGFRRDGTGMDPDIGETWRWVCLRPVA